MARSIHTTYSNSVFGLTKREIDEQAQDPYSDLTELARKSSIKRNVIKERKNKKQAENANLTNSIKATVVLENNEQENYLEIQLLSFDRPTSDIERYYFLEMSTLQVTRLIDPYKKILSLEIISYTDDNDFISEQTILELKTIGDFNNFFTDNQEYYIHNCELKIENNLQINSHDDGEVSVQFKSEQTDFHLIEKIFNTFKLDKKLVEILKRNEGHYIAIDKESNVLNNFKDFDDYIKNGR